MARRGPPLPRQRGAVCCVWSEWRRPGAATTASNRERLDEPQRRPATVRVASTTMQGSSHSTPSNATGNSRARPRTRTLGHKRS